MQQQLTEEKEDIKAKLEEASQDLEVLGNDKVIFLSPESVVWEGLKFGSPGVSFP